MDYDRIYYWIGGTERGKWNSTFFYTDEALEQIRVMGYVAHPGKLSIGPPEGAPSKEQLENALNYCVIKLTARNLNNKDN